MSIDTHQNVNEHDDITTPAKKNIKPGFTILHHVKRSKVMHDTNVQRETHVINIVEKYCHIRRKYMSHPR